MNQRSWLMVRARRSELRIIAVLQLIAAAGWWLLAFYPDRNNWFLLVAILWTLVAVRSLVSWRLWRPQPWPPTEPSKTEPSKTEPSKTEPSKTEPSKTEPSKTEPSGAEPAER